MYSNIFDDLLQQQFFDTSATFFEDLKETQMNDVYARWPSDDDMQVIQ
jgi:hypothetical protein